MMPDGSVNTEKISAPILDTVLAYKATHLKKKYTASDDFLGQYVNKISP